MSPENHRNHDVIIAGAGPVGLSLALKLARRGVRVLVLEQEARTSDLSRAPAIWPVTQEVLARLGVLNTFLQAGIVMGQIELLDTDSGNLLLRVPLHELAEDTPYPQLLILPQSRTEGILLAAVQQHDCAEVRFNTQVTSFSEKDAWVNVKCRCKNDEGQFSARVLVGCDGAHSRVREALGLEFEGSTFPFEAALADITLDQDDWHSPALTSSPRMAVAIRIRAGTCRLILPFSEEQGLALDERIEQTVRSLFDRPYKLLWKSEFRLHNRVAAAFAHGRVVLAGDAAHLNSPVGGQGMNAGIQDTEALGDAILKVLEENNSAPLLEYSSQRRRKIFGGVSRFTSAMTRVLFVRRGRYVKKVLKTFNKLLRIDFVRRRFLRKLAMLD